MSWTSVQFALVRRAAFALLVMGFAGHQLAELLERRLGLSPYYPSWTSVTFGVAAVIALRAAAKHHPFRRFGAANGVTSLRLLLTSLVAGLTSETSPAGVSATAAALALLATALDGLDGWLARRTAMTSDFGARYDMETDAFLILVLAMLAWEYDKAGAWIVLSGAMRYLFVLAGYGWRWLESPLPPSQRRKAVCVIQILGLCAMVSPLLTPPVSTIAGALTLAALTWSFGVDVLWLRRHRA